MARKRLYFTPGKPIRPTVGMRVTVICGVISFRGGDRRVGKVVSVGQGRRGDMFIVEFNGYRETFREIDLRTGQVQILAA